MRRSPLLLAAIATLAGGIAIWLRAQTDVQSKPVSITGPEDSAAGGIDTRHSKPELTAPANAEQRAPSAPRMRVLDSRAQPIAGAQARWIPKRPEFITASASWPDLDWVAIEAAIRTFTSDEDGWLEFSFDPADAQALGSTLWILHPEHRARSIELEFPRAALALPETITLEDCGELNVVVIDGSGAPVAGAAVTQLADLRRADLTDPATHGALARRWLRVVTSTDGGGHATLPALDVGQVVWAAYGELQSERWAGSAPADVRLSLEPTFVLSGKVVGDAETALATPASVRWVTEHSDELRLQERLRVRTDGTFGPVRLPRVLARQYLFQLEAPGCAMAQVAQPLPESGASVSVQFDLALGVDISVRVLGEGAQPLENAIVIGNWSLDGVWRKVERATDHDGLARFRHAYPGEFWVRARRNGYVGRLLVPIDVTTPPPEPIVVQLERATGIRGRVTHAGAPVRDFTIYFWKDDPNEHNHVSVTGSADGRFEVDEAPIGKVTLLATSDAAPSPAPLEVETSREHVAEVEIELPAALEGRGRVVDAFTSQPMPGATIQLWNSTNDNRSRRWRAPFPIGPSGDFVVRGFAPGITWCDIAAPGYATRGVAARGSGTDTIDLGWIGLVHEQALEVQLVSDGNEDFSTYKVSLDGGRYIDLVPFPKDGRRRFEKLEPGQWMVRIISPGPIVRFETAEVVVGRDTALTIPVGGRRLIVDLDFQGAAKLVPKMRLVVYHAGHGGASEQQNHAIRPNRSIEVRGVESDSAVLAVLDPDGVTLCARHVRLDGTDPQRVTLIITGKSRQLRIIDRDHRPVAGVNVIGNTQPASSDWMLMMKTDERGEVRLENLEVDPLYVALQHPDRGLMPSQLLRFDPEKTEPIVLEFDPRGELAVRLIERNAGAQGVRVVAEDSQRVQWGLSEAFTNEMGLVRWGPAAPGDYTVQVDSPGWWPTKIGVHATGSSTPFDVQVRRVGSLELNVRSVLDRPLPGVSIALRSVELGQSAADWMASGMVTASNSALITDENGHLRIDGLPNGDFEWTAVSSNGSERSGRLNVPPHAIGREQIELP